MRFEICLVGCLVFGSVGCSSDDDRWLEGTWEVASSCPAQRQSGHLTIVKVSDSRYRGSLGSNQQAEAQDATVFGFESVSFDINTSTVTNGSCAFPSDHFGCNIVFVCNPSSRPCAIRMSRTVCDD